MIKSFAKKLLLKYIKSIILDSKSKLNYSVVNDSISPKYPCQIINSDCNFTVVNEGCFISDAKTYGDINLGRFVTITGPGTVVKSLREKIHIGSFSSIGQNVCVIDFNHNFNRISSNFINYNIFKGDYLSDIITNGSIVIEEDVWIGSNSIVLPGIKIGRGSIIGGGAVVSKDIPAYSIAVGNPAKVISKRFEDSQIEFLEKLKWWEWNIEKIKKNKQLFNSNLKAKNDQDLIAIEAEIKH